METRNPVISEQCGVPPAAVLMQSVKEFVYSSTVDHHHHAAHTNEKFLVLTNTPIDHNNHITLLDTTNMHLTENTATVHNLENLCRVCANANSTMIPIFEGDGVVHNLFNKINKYLPITITTMDTLPLQLCYHCASTLVAWNTLVEGCLIAEQRLQQIQAELQVKEQQNKEVLTLHTLSETQETVGVPEITNLHTNNDQPITEDNLEITNKLRDTVETQQKQDTINGFVRTRNQHKRREMAINQFIKEELVIDDDNIDDSNDDDNEKTVQLSKKSSKTKKSTSRRSRCHPCMHCDFTAKQKKILQNHLSEFHSDLLIDNNVKKPPVIDKELIDESRCEVDGRVYYQCKNCGKHLFSPYTLSWHMRIHTGERPFTCHVCGRQFRVNQGLARHLRETHAGIKNFSCEICNRMFATKRTLDDHRRIHTGERPYVCNICGKSFKQTASLLVHSRTHTDIFPFKCVYCEQGFRTRPPLMIHLTKHTGEKPYTCEICNRAFRIKFELKRHKLVHSEDKPWQCQCGLSFRQKRYLVNHQKLYHDSDAQKT